MAGDGSQSSTMRRRSRRSSPSPSRWDFSLFRRVSENLTATNMSGPLAVTLSAAAGGPPSVRPAPNGQCLLPCGRLLVGSPMALAWQSW
jgi:hypothetical protein